MRRHFFHPGHEKLLLLAFLFAANAAGAAAQTAPPADLYAGRWTLLAGLNQPIISHGFNVAGTYFAQRFTFEYSHGMFLTYRGTWNLDKNIQSVYVPYSTGLGVGYRLTRYLDLRAEAKNHRFEAQLNRSQSVTYTNTDLGLGAYYRLYPFGRRAGWARGLVVEPSVRYWHYVYSTLPGGEVAFRKDDGTPAVHKPYNFGLFANVSLGYTFGLRQPR